MASSDRDDAPTTPPVAFRPGQAVEPVSGLRDERSEGSAVNDTALSIEHPSAAQNPDTLMSLPRPLPHGELPYETRIRQLEDRLETLETRVAAVERGHTLVPATRATPWWFWLLFLLGLAVTWRLLETLR